MVRADDALKQFAAAHPEAKAANAIWPWSPGGQPALPSFQECYGRKAAIIGAVDVILGLGKVLGMTTIRPPGVTGFIDTNYEAKADAAIEALADHDLVYIHLEAIDECGHLGDLRLKMQALEDFDTRIVGRVLDAVGRDREIAYAVLPDHPVPIRLRKHTRTPVPVAISAPHLEPDAVAYYSETLAPTGGLGHLKGPEFMRTLLSH